MVLLWADPPAAFSSVWFECSGSAFQSHQLKLKREKSVILGFHLGKTEIIS